jgi:hypothetical protein
MRTPTNPQIYTLALHWAYMTCPDIDLPEPQRSEAILHRLREPFEDDPSSHRSSGGSGNRRIRPT